MATGAQGTVVGVNIDKMILDLQDCIRELKREFQDTQVPINDDNTTFHRFCAKLEFLLQNGMKEKLSLFGGQKGYWDYFCKCLVSCRGGIHDGLRFVKSNSELRSSLGRGRALLRFCLVHHCLADTLQQCTLNGKVTSDLYYETSPLLRHEMSSVIITALYELNDINFDLAPTGYDLDMAWPTFARKQFGSPYSWKPPSRNISISSLSSLISATSEVKHPIQTPVSDMASVKETGELEQLQMDLAKAETVKSTLMLKVQHMEEEREGLETQISELRSQLQKEAEENSSKVKSLEALCDEYKLQVTETKGDWEQKEKELRNKVKETEGLVKEKEIELQYCRGIAEELGHTTTKLSETESLKQDLELEVSQVQDKLKNKIIEGDQYKNELIHIKTKLETKEIENKSLIARMDELLQQMEQNSKEQDSGHIQRLLGEIMMKEKENGEVKNQLVDITEKLKNLEKLNEALQEQVSSVEAENSELRTKLEKVSTILQENESQVSNNERQNTQLQNQVHSLKEVISLTKAMLAIRNSEVESLKVQIKAFDTKVKQEHDRRTDMLKRMDYAEKINAELKSQFEMIKSENFQEVKMKYDEKIKMLMQENQRLENEVLEKGKQVDISEARCAELHARALEFSGLLNEQENVITGLQKQLHESFDKNKILAQQMHVLNSLFTEIEKTEIDFQKIKMLGDLPDTQNEGGENCENCDHNGVDTTETSEFPEIQSVPSTNTSVMEDNIEGAAESCYTSVNTNRGSQLVISVSKTFLKLRDLILEKKSLQEELDNLKGLNSHLEKKVTEQEARLSSVICELDKTWSLVAKLKIQHNQLHTSEAVLKYELKEKRKLLNKLKDELELSRQKWARVRQKNSESEEEWQNLRDEFAKRKQQTSEESAFSEDKCDVFEGTEGAIGGQALDVAVSEIVTVPVFIPAIDKLVSEINIPPELLPSLEPKEETGDEGSREELDSKAKRLKILEEQCKMLYSKLMASTARSVAMASRLVELHEHFGSNEKQEDILGEDELLSPEPESVDTAYVSESTDMRESEEREALEMPENVDFVEEEAVDETSRMNVNTSDVGVSEIVTASVTEIAATSVTETVNASTAQITNGEKEVQVSGRSTENTIQSSTQGEMADEEVAPLNDSQTLGQNIIETTTQVTSSDAEVVPNVHSGDFNGSATLESHSTNTERHVISSVAQLSSLSSSSELSSSLTETSAIPPPPPMPTFSLLPPVAMIGIEGTGETTSDAFTPIGEDSAVGRLLIQQLPKRLEILRQQKDELEKKVIAVEVEKEEAHAKLTDAERRMKLDKVAKRELENNLEEAVKRMEEMTMEFQVEQMKKDVEIKKKEHELSKSRQDLIELARKQELLMSSSTAVQQEVMSLRFQLSTQSIENNRALKGYKEQEQNISTMIDRMSDQEVLITSLEKQLEELRAEREHEREELWRQLEDVRLSFTMRNEECHTLHEELKKTSRELNEQQSAKQQLQEELQSLQLYSQELIERQQAEITQLREDSIQLRQKVVKLIKEKDLLWQHNDRLTHLQKVHATDKWMDDKEAAYCLGCQVPFSIIIRRHHCRSCGRIFCHICSNNWVLTAGSSRRTRICNECLILHTEIENQSNTSVIIDGDNGVETEESSDYSLFSTLVTPVNSPSETMQEASLTKGTPEDSAVSSPYLVCSPSHTTSSDSKIEEDDEGFSVISDEEMTRSLSGSSPYDPSPITRARWDACEQQNCAMRTVQDVEEHPESTEVWVSAATVHAVPILVEEAYIKLFWQFSTEPKSIAFAVIYKPQETEESNTEKCKVILSTTRVKSHLHTIKGQLMAKKPGLYSLLFDNSFSRFTAKKVSYSLTVKKRSDSVDTSGVENSGSSFSLPADIMTTKCGEDEAASNMTEPKHMEGKYETS